MDAMTVLQEANGLNGTTTALVTRDLDDAILRIFDHEKRAEVVSLKPALDGNFVTRQEAARVAAVSAGIEWPKTILPEGTALYSSGVTALKADRARWARLPFAADALPVIRAALEAEDRRDDVVPVAAIQLDPFDGRINYPSPLVGGQLEAVGYDEHAFRQLVAQVPGLATGPRGTANVLLFLDNAERAGIANPRIPAAAAEVTVRTKMAHSGSRVARAFLSKRYADVSDVDVANAIEVALNGDGRIARLDYKPGDERSRFEVFWPSEVAVETFCVGDVHRALVQITNSETGEGSVRVTAGLVRAACANLTLVNGDGVEIRIRHVGDAETRRGQMRAAIRAALGQLEPLIQAITLSARTPFPEGETCSSLIEKIAEKFNVTEQRAEAWESTYARGYSKSPTLWGLTSAITESAQGLDSWAAQAEEEKIAAQLVHVRWHAIA